MSAEAALTSPLDKFVAQVQGWPHWLAPSPHVSEGVVVQTARELLRRIQRQSPVPEWDRLPRSEVVGLTPPEAMAQSAHTARHWRSGLSRIAELALWRARQEGTEAAARAAFEHAYNLVRREVWHAAVSRWVGAWQYNPRKKQWQRTLFMDHSGASPAIRAAEEAAFHHAVHAMWVAVWGESEPPPLAPLIRLWRWGYWPLGILGNRFVVAVVRPVT